MKMKCLVVFGGILGVMAGAVGWAVAPETEQQAWYRHGGPQAFCGKGVPVEEWSKDRCKEFMRTLTDVVYDNHLKKDPKSAQKGMIYEWVVWSKRGQIPDQWVQQEGRDTMHDGAWFTAALCNAYRATDDRFYRDFLTEYPLPFYCKMLAHSDTLFAKAAPGRWMCDADKKLQKEGKLVKPIPQKGWIPYWWDDGASLSYSVLYWAEWNKLTDKQKENATAGADQKALPRLIGFCPDTSNHMAQDWAVLLLECWWLTRDERIKEAAFAQEDRIFDGMGGGIYLCDAAAKVAGSVKHLEQITPTDPSYQPGSCQAYSAFYGQIFRPMAGRWPVFCDNEEYGYYYGLAQNNGVSANDARRLMDIGMGIATGMRLYHDDIPEEPGWGQVESGPIGISRGKLDLYHSKKITFPCGHRIATQSLVVMGRALHAFQKYPGLWEAYRKDKYPDDYYLKILDDNPVKLDGAKDETYGAETCRVGALDLAMVSDLRNLYIWGKAESRPAKFKIYVRPDGQNRSKERYYDKGWKENVEIIVPWAEFIVDADGKVRAVNYEESAPQMMADEREMKTLIGVEADCVKGEKGFTFELKVPYTMSGPKQIMWANVLENVRLSVRSGEAVKNLYCQSTEARAKAFLDRYLRQAFTFWQKALDEMGYLPCSWQSGGSENKLSESAAYAHLLKALAIYVMHLDGKCLWEEQLKPMTR